MLNIEDNGALTLTMEGQTIATIDRAAFQNLTIGQLVAWENMVREEHYERSNGYWSKKQQMLNRVAELKKCQNNPRFPIKTTNAYNKEWEEKRRLAIDK